MERSLEEIRYKVKRDLEIQNKEKLDAYNSFYDVLNTNSNKDLVFISWEQLQTLKIGEKVKNVAEGAEFVKLSENDKEMVFHTILVDGGSFKLHYHNCIEICKILEGAMIETQRGNTKAVRYYGVGQRAIYDKGEKHSLYASEYTLIEVRFFKGVVMKLTKNFSKSEFECKCGCEMPKDILYNISKLAENLQIIRDYFNKSIKINSAYRCEYHNDVVVKGSKNSQHKKGLAADIVVENRQPKQVYNAINKLMKSGKVEKGGLGRYETFTHFDIRGYLARW